MSTSPYSPPPPARTIQASVPPIPRVSKGRVMRRAIVRSAQGVRAGLRVVFSGRPVLVVLFVLLLPFTGWLAYDRLFASSSPASSGPRTAVQLPEPQVIQDYFKAVQKGDADAAWSTLSPTEKARRVARNEDKMLLAQVFQIEQQSKMTYAAVHYTGSYQESGGRSALYFYVGEVGSGKQARLLPLVFAVDKDGTLSEVEDTLYDAVRAQFKGGP